MTLLNALEKITDARIDRCKKHKLSEILFIVLVGYLCGKEDIENIIFWAEEREEKLKKCLKLENGIPSADTTLRVLSLIDPKEFEKIFTEYTCSFINDLPDEKQFIAIDGKTIRGSKKNGNKGAHIVSAWADKLGLCLAQVKTSEKSNEITAIPEVL